MAEIEKGKDIPAYCQVAKRQFIKIREVGHGEEDRGKNKEEKRWWTDSPEMYSHKVNARIITMYIDSWHSGITSTLKLHACINCIAAILYHRDSKSTAT